MAHGIGKGAGSSYDQTESTSPRLEYFNPVLNYDGDYPHDELAAAKRTLISELKNTNSYALMRLKTKLKVDKFMNGTPIQTYLPPPQPYPFFRPHGSKTESDTPGTSAENNSDNSSRKGTPRKRRAAANDPNDEFDRDIKQWKGTDIYQNVTYKHSGGAIHSQMNRRY